LLYVVLRAEIARSDAEKFALLVPAERAGGVVEGAGFGKQE
jgi:hypothetical protein